MRSIQKLTGNVGLAKLMQAQRYLDKAAELYSEVLDVEGRPKDSESEREAFVELIAGCGLRLERLAGTVVYNDIFAGIDYEYD